MSNCKSLTKANIPCRRRALPRSRYCWQHHSRVFRWFVGSGIIGGILAVLAFFSDLSQLGLINVQPLFGRNSSPLRLVTETLSETKEGNQIVDITVRNVADEPIVIRKARVTLTRVVQLDACTDVPVSALKPTGTYDILIPTIPGVTEKELSQLVTPKSADRFQLILAPLQADTLYLFTITLIYNESQASLDAGEFLFFINDQLVAEIPEAASTNPKIDQNCLQKNLRLVRELFVTSATRNDRAADLERRARAAPTLNEGSLPHSRAEPVQPSPTYSPKVALNPKGVQAALARHAWLVWRGKSLEEGQFCSGTIIGPESILTAEHCLVNRLTGQRLEPNEFVVVLTYDRRQLDVLEFIGADATRDVVVLRVSPSINFP